MRSSSSAGFDLREAVDSLRQAFGPVTTKRDTTGAHEVRDIRAAVLLELGDEPMHGYQIIRAIETRSGGTWKPGPGAVYPTLQLLLDEELVTATQTGERKVYSLTEAGRLALANLPAVEQPREEHDGEQRHERDLQGALALAKSGATLGQAVAQVAQVGSPQKNQRAIAVLEDARRRLYAILSED